MKIKFYVAAILSLILSVNAHAQDVDVTDFELNLEPRPQEERQLNKKNFWGLSVVRASIKYSEEPVVINDIVVKDEDLSAKEVDEFRLLFGRKLNENLAFIGYLGIYGPAERVVDDLGTEWASGNDVLVFSTISSSSFGFALGYSTPIGLTQTNNFYGNIGIRSDNRTTEIKLYDAGVVRQVITEDDSDMGVELEGGFEVNFSDNGALRFGLVSSKTMSGLNVGIRVNF